MSNPTLASITAELEAVETAARGRGSLTCDHLAGRIANIRGELQQIAQPQPPAEAQGGGDMTECGHSKYDPCHNCEPLDAPPSAPVGVEGLVADMRRWVRSAEAAGPYAAGRTVVVQEWANQLEALAQQLAACTHSWHDYGTVNRAWCSRCNAVAVIGHEDRPYGALSVTDDGEYRTNPIQQPAAVECPYRTRCDCLCSCKYGMAGDGALAAQQGGAK